MPRVCLLSCSALSLLGGVYVHLLVYVKNVCSIRWLCVCCSASRVQAFKFDMSAFLCDRSVLNL